LFFCVLACRRRSGGRRSARLLKPVVVLLEVSASPRALAQLRSPAHSLARTELSVLCRRMPVIVAEGKERGRRERARNAPSCGEGDERQQGPRRTAERDLNALILDGFDPVDDRAHGGLVLELVEVGEAERLLSEGGWCR